MRNCPGAKAGTRERAKAERFRVSTMRVLQIQLRSLCAMDVVAYGGAAAGIVVAIWQFAFGRIWLPDAMIIVLLSVSFFLPLRQLGSYFHVAMNGMTSSRRADGQKLIVPDSEHAVEKLTKPESTANADDLAAAAESVGDVEPSLPTIAVSCFSNSPCAAFSPSIPPATVTPINNTGTNDTRE